MPLSGQQDPGVVRALLNSLKRLRTLLSKLGGILTELKALLRKLAWSEPTAPTHMHVHDPGLFSRSGALSKTGGPRTRRRAAAYAGDHRPLRESRRRGLPRRTGGDHRRRR